MTTNWREGALDSSSIAICYQSGGKGYASRNAADVRFPVALISSSACGLFSEAACCDFSSGAEVDVSVGDHENNETGNQRGAIALAFYSELWSS
jgi:hypothetical protein